MASGHLDSQRTLPVFDPPPGGPSPLAKELRFTADEIVAVPNAPGGYVALLQPGPPSRPGLRRRRRTPAVDRFSKGRGESRGYRSPGHAPWRIKRDVLGEVTARRGCKPVSFVAVDDRWTALRFKHL